MARQHSPLWEEAHALARAAGAPAASATKFADCVEEGEAVLLGLREARDKGLLDVSPVVPVGPHADPITAALDASDEPDTDDADLSWADDATRERLSFMHYYRNVHGRMSEYDLAADVTATATLS